MASKFSILFLGVFCLARAGLFPTPGLTQNQPVQSSPPAPGEQIQTPQTLESQTPTAGEPQPPPAEELPSAPPAEPQAPPSQETQTPAREAPAPIQIHPGAIEYGRDLLLPHFGQAARNSFATGPSLIGLAVGGALAGGISTQDRKIADYWSAESPIGDWSEIGDQWGSGYIQPAIVLGMFGWARLRRNQALSTNAEVFAEALILDGLVINLIKPLVGRERPDSSDNLSFPSGHTGNAFTFAALMDDRYGHQWGIPMFALAAFVGLTRMEDTAHWASDVTFGAALGTVIGYGVSRGHDDYPYQKAWRRKNRVTLLPILPFGEDDRRGILLTLPVR